MTSYAKALYGWVFNTSRRKAGPPPDDLAPAVRWLETHTVPLSALSDAALVRKTLDGLALRMDGKAAAASTVARKRAVFSGALKYAVELRLLETHPMALLTWEAPKSDDEIDRAVVANPRQARRLIEVVREQKPELAAFFGCLYYAALRPEEALHLRADEYERPTRPGGWGWLKLTGALVTVGEGWNDGEGSVDERGLKHRAETATRRVPAAPALCTLLDWHLDEYGAGPEGRLFVSRRGPWGVLIPGGGARPVPNNSYTTAWRVARQKTLTAEQQRSLLAKRPYDLRHAAVSLWLNSGVPATQVAVWAGHSVNVLLKVYAKCIDGEEEAALRRIATALGDGEMRMKSGL